MGLDLFWLRDESLEDGQNLPDSDGRLARSWRIRSEGSVLSRGSRQVKAIAVSLSVILSGFAWAETPASQQANTTAKFLGPEDQWNRCGITLADVHLLWGGTAIYLQGSGQCVVRIIKKREEKRFNLNLWSEEGMALRKLLVEADFLTIQIKDRMGVPDEARPTITLQNAEGRTHKQMKWANDKMEPFDRVYGALLDLRKKTDCLKADYGGTYQSDWRPSAPPASQPAASEPPTTQPALTDQQMLKLATQVVIKDFPKAVVAPTRSKNLHLGQWGMPNPMPKFSFYCAVLGDTMAAPIRQYLAVSRSGQVIKPLKAEKFAELLAAEDKSKWKDEDCLNAAILWVHLMSVANEDGWKLLAKPEDFTAITFNMGSGGPGVEKQREAAKQIVAPKVERNDAQVAVTFYAWHLIGGYLRRWQVQIGPKTQAAKQELGQFGGGGYD